MSEPTLDITYRFVIPRSIANHQGSDEDIALNILGQIKGDWSAVYGLQIHLAEISTGLLV